MTTVHFGMGTNLGDRAAMLEAAIDALARHVTVRGVSSVYETAAWGVTDQPAFLNCCVAADTDLDPEELLRRVKEIESRLGRTPGERWGPRAIDIDLLLYDDLRIAARDLVVPHPRLTERAFALVPLAEIAPDARIAGADITVRDALAALERTPGDVRRIADPIAPSPRAAR